MNLNPEQTEKMKLRMAQTIRENAKIQLTPQNRENYFNSCIKHGDLLGQVTEEIKKEF